MQPTQRGGVSLVFALLLAAAAWFVWFSSRPLPDVVASHFNGAGIANGFMPRHDYVRFMLAVVIALPCVLILVPSVAISGSNPRLNLPNREYWMAPERRTDTLRYLRGISLRFSITLLFFLCYAHWLVVRANSVNPPVLSSSAMIVALILFLVVNLLWLVALLLRFIRIPD